MKKDILKYIKQVSVLYVEDNDATREEVEYFLKSKVKKLYIASNGEEGLELYKKYSPEIIITDVQMPKLNGIEMSKLIKEFDRNAKIIIITAFNDNEYLFDCIRINIDTYITKPLNINDLIDNLYKLAKSICLEKDNKEIYNTLKQYKDIVDERSIILKMDINANITYINKPFEEISGYSTSELIGKSFNMIKDEEINSKTYEDIWKILIKKKVWSGNIKNKKKNGEIYIVDTIIKPILDINENIIEFISLSNNITDLEKSREFFKNQTHKATMDLQESIRISKAYEDAIEQSNMILRVDKKYNIIYMNEAFCDISGYTQSELLGKHYSILKDYRIDDETFYKHFNKVRKHLDSGKVWKGSVSNTAKNGSLFHCNITIFPMRNKNGEIVEYMGIRHDITKLEELYDDLEESQREIIYKLAEIGDIRSKETGNHVKRVAEYSRLLARKISLDEDSVNALYTASPMHDIGKIGIPDSILNKPSKLNKEEWEVMKTHAEIGYNILKTSNRPILNTAAIISYTHHEKWDGSGYPRGLKGDEIHIFGRITAIIDVFDALSTIRPYKKSWPLEDITEYLIQRRGKHFDPKLIDILLDNIDEFLEIKKRYRD